MFSCTLIAIDTKAIKLNICEFTKINLSPLNFLTPFSHMCEIE